MQPERVANPVEVNIKNWGEAVKPPMVRNTTANTYVVDPAATDRSKRYTQIAAYEPNRLRMMIQVLDVAVALTVDNPPNNTPDASSATAAPANGGIVLLPNTAGDTYEFFGPDAWFVNSLAAVGRVTVVKEYGA